MTFHDSDKDGNSIQSPEDSKANDSNIHNVLFPKKRRFFTVEEKKAPLSGVKKFGMGIWCEIKVEYSEIFCYRTKVQLKDCYWTI